MCALKGHSKREGLERAFPLLHKVLRRNSSLGILFDGHSLRRQECEFSPIQSLRYYYVDRSTDRIIEHNRNWALGNAPSPIFQFAYLMLPTICNQRCHGCFMGQDKGRLPPHLSGPFFSEKELSNIMLFLKKHGAKAVVYGGGGELFTWEEAFDFIETVTSFGLRMVIFTNGTLLSMQDVARLNSLGVAIIISLRDTVEAYHNVKVNANHFKATLSTIENALSVGFQNDNRLAVEIPVTNDNEERVIEDFLPAMRLQNIVPIIEEYIQISVSDKERSFCHDFNQSRAFFEKVSRKDSEFGVLWPPEFGQRIVAQPQCKRPLYSFAIFPSGDVMDCPSHSICYGNFRKEPLDKILYSSKFKRAILDFDICACSVFYTREHDEIPECLPDYLETLM